MNTAEWILVAMLSITLFIFLVLTIILIANLINITKEVQKIVTKGQEIADNANNIVNNIKGITSVGGVVQSFTDKYTKVNKEEDKNDKKDNSKR